jgi:hypothetical protein
MDGGYIELLSTDGLKKINIDPTNAILMQNNTSTPESPIWETIFSANTDGSLNLSEKLRIGDWTSLTDKSIWFYNVGSNFCYLELQGSTGQFSIVNWQDIYILSAEDIEIRSVGECFIIGTNMEIQSYNGSDLTLKGGRDVYISPYDSTFDVIITTLYAYLGDNSTANNLIATMGDIPSLSGYATESWVSSNFASDSHTHSYATSSDISSAISAHEAAHH